MLSISQLTATLPQTGVVTWLGIRPQKRASMLVVDAITVNPEIGIVGDRYDGKSGKRQVTFIQAEHLPAIASMVARDKVLAEELRRNIVIKGINLLALKGHRFSLGDALLEHTGECHPCSRMEELFGSGGYNAVRGHGGITARVIQGGRITLGDTLRVLSSVK